MSNNNASLGGMGLASVLLVVFIILKLTKVIAWSWIWVLSPLWISVILWLLLFFIIVLLSK